MTDSTRCGGKKKIPVQEFGASTFWESCKGCVDCKPKCPYHDEDVGVKVSNCTCTPDPGVDVDDLITMLTQFMPYAASGSDYMKAIDSIRQLAKERDEAVRLQGVLWSERNEASRRGLAAEQRAEKAEGDVDSLRLSLQAALDHEQHQDGKCGCCWTIRAKKTMKDTL